MAKKKSIIIPEQEAEAQRIIDNMTSEKIERMAAFEQEFSKMPEKMQDAMFELVQQLQKMPAKKREELFESFDKLSSLFEGDDEDTDFDDSEEDEDFRTIIWRKNASLPQGSDKENDKATKAATGR